MLIIFPDIYSLMFVQIIIVNICISFVYSVHFESGYDDDGIVPKKMFK